MNEKQEIEAALSESKSRGAQDADLARELVSNVESRKMRGEHDPACIRCDKCERVTEHGYLESQWNEHHAFDIMYVCRVCGHKRVWGNCQSE